MALARAAGRLVVAKGKKVTVLELKKDDPDDETLLKHLLGPSGNLRAPTLRRGRTLFVGFHAEEFPPLLSGRKS